MSLQPNIIKLGKNTYRLDLRSKAFDAVRSTLANGRKTLEFNKRSDAEKKAEEVAAILTQYGAKRIESFDKVFSSDPVKLAERLMPWGKTISDAVNFYIQHLTDQDAKQKSATVATLVDEWIAEKQKRVEQKTLRKRTFQTIQSRGRFFKEKFGNRPVATIMGNRT